MTICYNSVKNKNTINLEGLMGYCYKSEHDANINDRNSDIELFFDFLINLIITSGKNKIL